jgi:hypothetical protein
MDCDESRFTAEEPTRALAARSAGPRPVITLSPDESTHGSDGQVSHTAGLSLPGGWIVSGTTVVQSNVFGRVVHADSTRINRIIYSNFGGNCSSADRRRRIDFTSHGADRGVSPVSLVSLRVRHRTVRRTLFRSVESASTESVSTIALPIESRRENRSAACSGSGVRSGSGVTRCLSFDAPASG